jgi:uncharacterized protein YecT (DUF1311 family)
MRCLLTPLRRSRVALPQPHPRFGYQGLTDAQRAWLLHRDGCTHEGMAYAPGARIKCLRCGRRIG